MPEASGFFQFVTTTFFGEKLITVQIRYCNDCLPSIFDEWSNNEHSKIF